MNQLEMLVDWLDHEQWASEIMLGWFSRVPIDKSAEPEFQQAVDIVGHIVGCRENWLDRLVAGGNSQVDWWPVNCEIAALALRSAKTFRGWREMLTATTVEELAGDFDYLYGDQMWRFNVQCQVMQMVGHGFYHRGQVALLISGLGGTISDTDYLYWKLGQAPGRWGKVDPSPEL